MREKERGRGRSAQVAQADIDPRYRPTRDDYDFVKDFAARVFAEP